MDLLFEAFEMPWAGLAARDTLRLEAGFPLYGNELSRDISPIQAGLNWSIDFDKDEFVGKSALLEKINSGIKNKVLFLHRKRSENSKIRNESFSGRYRNR